MPKISEITNCIQEFAPIPLQEEYDNAGLLTGNKNTECTGALLTLDCTEEVVHEALENKCNLIIAHHPIIFKGLKKITGSNYVERTIIKAIKNDIALYACHTNADNVKTGVNQKIAQKIGLVNTRILLPKKNTLQKLAVFVPESHADVVRQAIFEAGAGSIGNYSHCSFNTNGTGTFKGNESSNPFLGEPGKLSKEPEIRIEVILENYISSRVIEAMQKAHPYEEVAYDIYPLSNNHPGIGSGLLGELNSPMPEKDFLTLLKQVFNLKTLKHTKLTGKEIKKVALCGGSGQFLLQNAINCDADCYISADFKYHEYFDADGKILIADIGHFETEQFTPELFYEVIQEKFPKFALHLSKINTNPVNYF